MFSVWVLALLFAGVSSLWLVLPFVPRGRTAMRLARVWARGFLLLTGCRLRVCGVEHLRHEACAVLVANHTSVVDPLVLIAGIPADYRFVLNHSAARLPFVRLVVRKAGHLVVDRRSARSRAACGRAMIESLQAGTSLLLFPEGTLGTGAVLPFKAGAFRAAVSAGRPVIPIAIEGTRRILPRGARMLARSPIEIRILPAIRSKGEVEGALRLRDEAEAAITGALEKTCYTEASTDTRP